MKIYCSLDNKENCSLEDIDINLNINNNKIFNYTFWDNIKSLPKFISNEGLDFLYLSLFVFGIDRLVYREAANDSWSRDFQVYIPVLNLEIWNENKKLVEEMLSFLSGDNWNIEFRKRDYTDKEVDLKNNIIQENCILENCNKFCMFSGGMDSFIGAIDLLSSEEGKNIIFISHYGGGKGTKEYQDILRDKFIEKYDLSKENFYSFYAVAKSGVEDTTRTRSLMFFANAIALSTVIDKEVELIIPENGVISLNIPLTNSRLGTSSTRTTHPYYFELLQKLLNNLGINIKIKNPYQFMTKGEMAQNCKDKEFFNNNIWSTMSCSHPDSGRMNGEKESCHCGNCLPCTIRRAAFKKANIIDNTRYRDTLYDSGPTARLNLNSYKLGIAKFNEKFAFLTIQKSGPITKNIDKYTKLYVRGIYELKEFLEGLNE
ncbi:Qat anti-phage system QueC-like protein QatC [Clostridium perfringens]|uniref:Qat anti-phage system QueC-like protein QatC n=1 Tax=Clostridium perfringens TaxID=1502 RepID=UPI003BAA7049